MVWQRALAVLGCIGIMISASGCAKKENVIRDEPIAGKELTVKSNSVNPKTESAITKHEDNIKKTGSSVPEVADRQPVKADESLSAIERIYFSFDSSDLSREARDSLTRNEKILATMHNDAKLRIEGNCDQRGSAEYTILHLEKDAQKLRPTI